MIVWLHIGTPKSGTTYLQDLMGRNRQQLAADGVLWPGEDWRDQVRAVRDVLDFFPNGVDNPAIRGWWATVRDRILAWDGPAAIMSMEWLVHARPRSPFRWPPTPAGTCATRTRGRRANTCQ